MDLRSIRPHWSITDKRNEKEGDEEMMTCNVNNHTLTTTNPDLRSAQATQNDHKF